MEKTANAWVIVAGAVGGFLISVLDYFNAGNGIDHTEGVVLVIASTALALGASLLLAVPRFNPKWLRILLVALLLAGILGTGFAAYMLEAWLLIGFMAVSLIGWLLYLAPPARGELMSRRFRQCLFLAVMGCALAAVGPAVAENQTWSTFNGDLRAQKYSTAIQITPQNVDRLEVAWKLHTGDVKFGTGGFPETAWSATPLFVNNTLYLGTPLYRIFAVEPDTGRVKWTYDTKSSLQPLTQSLRTRGAAYWQAARPLAGRPCQKIVYMGTMDAKLHAVDADTGKRCAGFAQGGVLDINRWNTVNAKWPLSILQPPTVYKDTVIIGWAGKDNAFEADPPGTVFGVDARSGKLKWTFDAIPKGLAARTGTANVWASMAVDPDAGIVYLPVSSPSPNFYGGDRKGAGDVPLGTSVTALDAETGRLIWSRQLVHHDLWDYDTVAAPTLVDIEKGGRKIPALVQVTKQGFLFVINRLTGEPVYPVVERPVPASDIAGEQAARTQPFVDVPKPVLDDRWPGIFGLADALSFGYCSATAAKLRIDGKFTPPSLKGTLSYPGMGGGIEWGGGAVDPVSQTYVVNSSSIAQIYQLLTRADYDKAVRETGRPAGTAQKGAPYAFRGAPFLTPFGMPCWKPPYGTLSSYDLKTGKLLWREPFGQTQKWGFYMPESWGSVTTGGPIITRSGLIFIGASTDSRVRAINLKTGKVLWKAQVDAPALSIPASYTYKGKQYIAFTAGGNSFIAPKISDELVAFALPD